MQLQKGKRKWQHNMQNSYGANRNLLFNLLQELSARGLPHDRIGQLQGFSPSVQLA